jgi:flavin-dependent dehydrogenase
MKEKNKIAVLGAGIIGLYVSYKLQKKGFQVFVFEKKDEIGGKPCSALISERIKKSLPITEELYERKVCSILVHFRNRDLSIGVKPCLLHFNRQKLDEFIFELAREKGVKFFFNEEIKDFPRDFYKIIDCRGALAGSDKKNFRLGIQYFVERSLKNQQVEIFPFRGEKYGFLWKIPKKEEVEYGGIGSEKEITKKLKEYLRKEDIVFQEEKLKAALIPQGLYFSKQKNVFLLGDSAGLTKPTTGGGVIWGMKAVDILIDNFSDFDVAEKKIKRFFKIKILKGKLAVRLGYFVGDYFGWLLPKKVKIDADLY